VTVREGSRRSREIAVLVAVVGAVVLLAAFAGFLFLQDRDTDDAEPDAAPTPKVRPAFVHESFQDACDALVDKGIRGQRAKEPATEDKEEVADAYLDPESGPVLGIGLTVCDRGWVIVVGVDERTAKVPSVGSNGTPVIAYLKAPYVAE
jgi:hypothetical protein